MPGIAAEIWHRRGGLIGMLWAPRRLGKGELPVCAWLHGYEQEPVAGIEPTTA